MPKGGVGDVGGNNQVKYMELMIKVETKVEIEAFYMWIWYQKDTHRMGWSHFYLVVRLWKHRFKI